MPKLAATLLFAAFAAFVIWQTAYWARHITLNQIGERSRQTLDLIVETLRGDLSKFQSLPQLLSADIRFRLAVKGNLLDHDIEMINRSLVRINDVVGALETYLMNAEGETIAASNWASEKSFVGQNFSYRPYFQSAIQGALGRYFALGTTSGERGYYFAYPVRDGTEVSGAVVVKMHVGHHEDSWATQDHEVIVADRYGVIFLSSVPEWRLKSLGPLDAEAREALNQSRRYANAVVEPLRLSTKTEPGLAGQLLTIDGFQSANGQFLVQEETMGEAEWRVMLLARTSQVVGQVQLSLLVSVVILISVVLAAMAFYQRRQRLSERIALQEAAKEQLERRVESRTRDLTAANTELQKEIAERKRAEEEVRRTQETLVQATKLAALGQMSAGLSHELNQPLAAIRSYADNARAFLDRERPETASENLKGISELTERMARIIKNLRTYARRESIEVRPTSLASALEESLLLMDQRLRTAGIEVFRPPNIDDVQIMGGDVRLQQVFVNLISNAIDAMDQAEKREIHIDVNCRAEEVAIRILDTGPGIPEERLMNVFDPFFTTKTVGKGMGLGLSITWGLIQQFRGTITAANAPQGGALFEVTLHRAEDRGTAQPELAETLS
ncbi:MAG: ATP-binding protein [Magnetovibrionaceae bacterium]